MFDKGDESVLELGSQLDHKLVVGVDGEAGRYEAHVQSAAERHEHVHGPPVIQANDSVDSFGELGTNCKRKREKKYE